MYGTSKVISISIINEIHHHRSIFTIMLKNFVFFYLDPSESENTIPVTLKDQIHFEDRYSTHEVLGSGRYGKVRRVVETSTGRSFAAKFVSTTRKEFRKQVEREISIMNMLRHPKLLQLFDAYEGPRESIMITE